MLPYTSRSRPSRNAGRWSGERHSPTDLPAVGGAPRPPAPPPPHKVGSFCFSFDFSRSLCLSWLRAAIACCNFLRTDGFFVLFSVFPVNSRNAAVITSTSLALKKTKYLGGSTDLSRFRLKSMPYFFATFSKALMLLSVISMLES